MCYLQVITLLEDLYLTEIRGSMVSMSFEAIYKHNK